MRKVDLRHVNHRVYNLDCHAISLPGSQAGVMACTLAPGEMSEAHNHLEREAFLFTAGTANVITSTGALRIEAGEAVFFDPFESHTVVNESTTFPVTFQAIYWQDQEVKPTTASGSGERPPPLLVFSTPPTPNGDLHCGHLSGPYIAGDVLVRAQRIIGGVAWHVSGRDDHQTYVEKKALQERKSPQEVADDFAAALQKTWQAYEIELDGFIAPDRGGAYAAFVQEGLGKLIEAGLVEAQTGLAAYSAEGAYLHEAFISGGCPHCGESSDGNACEACGRPNSCTDLNHAQAYGSAHPPVVGQVTRLVFRLSRLQERLENYVKSSEMSSHTLTMSLSMLEDGLRDIPVTHPTGWGLPVSACGVEGQILYVWFEMAFGYLWGASQLPCADGANHWARATSVYNGNVRVAHCYGFDNSWYHTILFPAVYLALGLTPPQVHFVNELLDLDGAKFSTSREHLIWGRDLRAVLPSDLARYALLRNRPEGMRSNFDLNDIEKQLKQVFSIALPEWIEEFSRQVAYMGDRLPELGAWIGEHRHYYVKLQTQAAQLRHITAPESASPRRIAQLFEEIVLDGVRFQREQAHLFEGRDGLSNYRRTAVALGAAGLRLLCMVAQIITPKLGNDLAEWLDLEQPFADGIDIRFLDDGHMILPGSRPTQSIFLDRLKERVADAMNSL